MALAPADAASLAAAEDLHRQLAEQGPGLLGIPGLQRPAGGDDKAAARSGNGRIEPAEKSGEAISTQGAVCTASCSG